MSVPIELFSRFQPLGRNERIKVFQVAVRTRNDQVENQTFVLADFHGAPMRGKQVPGWQGAPLPLVQAFPVLANKLVFRITGWL